MFLYRIYHEQDTPAFQGYTAAVVVAACADDACLIRPSFTLKDGECFPCSDDEWCSPLAVRVEFLGVAAPALPAGRVIMTNWVSRAGQFG